MAMCKPKVGRPEIELVAPDGTRKRLPVLGRCGDWIFVWWPGAGAYDLNLRHGALVRPGGAPVDVWRASQAERERVRELSQEAFR